MAGPKAKPFRGKKPIKDLREFKNREIKKSLVHRARLRKNYFKLLDKEGVPQGDEDETHNEEVEENKEEVEKHKESSGRSRAPLPPQLALSFKAERRPERPKPMNFAERAKLAKQRKEEQRRKVLDDVRAKREALEKKAHDRERRKESLSKKTRTGQPLMGPRITNLLDKIRNN